MEEVSWTQEQMLEVSLKEPDDFLKVRETLSRIGVASRKERNYISPVIFYINRVDILLYILKNYLRWMVRILIYQKMISHVETQLQTFLKIGDSYKL